MTDLIKICPFCAEEINKEAIKCKHCKEFLNVGGKSENSTLFPESIASQNFGFAIGFAVIQIIFTLANEFYDSNDLFPWCLIFCSIAEVCLWIYFRKYLENFKANKTIKRVNWYIALMIIFGLLSLITKTLPESNTSEEWKDTDSLMLFSIIYIILLIVVYIRIGNSLQKIKNDSVGLLKELGMALSYLSPIIFLIIIVGSIIDNKAISHFGVILGEIPTIIMIMIFLRVQKKIANTVIRN